MVEKTTEIEELLRDKYKSAKRGLSFYKKLKKRYKAKDTEYRKVRKAGTYDGKEEYEEPRKPALIFQPDGYSDDAIYSLTCLRQLVLTVDPLRIVFITTNPDMREYAELFRDDVEVEIIDETASKDLINCSLMLSVDENFYIASLTEPYGRWGDRVVQSGMVGAEKCFALGVYRAWNYSPEALPCYEGTDPKVLDFLRRAECLQKESLRLDMEAKEKYE